MSIRFYKYHGTGNDFIIVDNRNHSMKFENRLIKNLCDRKSGIGADGFILLLDHLKLDFEMKFFNSDGNEGSMCGNGGRCIVAFAKKIGLINQYTQFQTIDGAHKAKIDSKNWVKLKMQDVLTIEKGEGYYHLNTGSPQYVTFVDNVHNVDVYREGRKIRFNERFKKEGTNVNFVQTLGNTIFVRTYEQGVEDETLSCGTGIIASAICSVIKNKSDKNTYRISTLGGNLKVNFQKKSGKEFKNIWLEGPTSFVFYGHIET